MTITNKFLGYYPKPQLFVPKSFALWILMATAVFSCKEDEVKPGDNAESVWVLDRLYFGRSMPNGEEVSEQDWDQFVKEVVTPLFPDGMTVWNAQGQWQDETGVIIQEPTFILEVAHEKSDADEQKLDEIIGEYKTRFQQESVLQITEQIEVEF